MRTARDRHNSDDPVSLSDDHVVSLHEDRSGELWVGTAYGGLNRFDRAIGAFITYGYDRNDPEASSRTFMRVILEDNQGAFWVGTESGLTQFDPSTGSWL